MGHFTTQTSWKTKNKMGGRRPEKHITDSGHARLQQTSRRQRRMEATSEGVRAQKGLWRHRRIWPADNDDSSPTDTSVSY